MIIALQITRKKSADSPNQLKIRQRVKKQISFAIIENECKNIKIYMKFLSVNEVSENVLKPVLT